MKKLATCLLTACLISPALAGDFNDQLFKKTVEILNPKTDIEIFSICRFGSFAPNSKERAHKAAKNMRFVDFNKKNEQDSIDTVISLLTSLTWRMSQDFSIETVRDELKFNYPSKYKEHIKSAIIKAQLISNLYQPKLHEERSKTTQEALALIEEYYKP